MEAALPEYEAELGEGALWVACLKVQVLAPGRRNAQLPDQRLVLPAQSSPERASARHKNA